MGENQNTPAPSADIRVKDATEKNWVDRFCPLWARPYMRLSRADRPAGTWLLLIPCWWGLLLAIWAGAELPTMADLWIAIACGIGAFLMRGAGCTWNDIADRKIDAQVARTKSRPIPSGQVSAKQAFVWMCVQALLALGVLLTFNTFTILLAMAALVPVAIYPFAKRFTWWPQVFLGLAFNWGALVGWTAHTGSLTHAPLWLYLAGIIWTLFYDTIYALQDKEDDALIGVKSTARLFGAQTKKWLLFFVIATLTILLFAIITAFTPAINMLSVLVAIATIWAFGWHLTWQLRTLDIDDAEICLKLFRANRDAGLIIVIGLTMAIIVQNYVSIG